MMSSDRRLHERRLIEEILGERYEPHMSERSPDAREEDPSTIEARKRADAVTPGHTENFGCGPQTGCS